MDAFKKSVKSKTQFKGRPLINGKYSKSYIKYAKNNDDHISLPNDILYKGKFVKKETIKGKKMDHLKKQYKNILKKEMKHLSLHKS